MESTLATDRGIAACSWIGPPRARAPRKRRALAEQVALGLIGQALLYIVLVSPVHAGQTARILCGDEPAAIHQTHGFHIHLAYPGAATRVTALVLKPGDRSWTVLENNAPRAGSTPYVQWRPDRLGVHTLRIDVVTPGEDEIRKTHRIRVVEDAVSLEIYGGRPALGTSVILEARFSASQQGRSLAFAVKWDDGNRWESINGGRTPNSIRWYPARAGTAELRVRATNHRGERIEGFSRVQVLASPQPVRMTGRSRVKAPWNMEMPDRKPMFTIDQRRAPVGEERTLTILLYYEPRANRRVTVRYRHILRDREWVVYRRNADRLILPWTPRHPGEYDIEVSTEDPAGGPDLRMQIRFTALASR